MALKLYRKKEKPTGRHVLHNCPAVWCVCLVFSKWPPSQNASSLLCLPAAGLVRNDLIRFASSPSLRVGIYARPFRSAGNAVLFMPPEPLSTCHMITVASALFYTRDALKSLIARPDSSLLLYRISSPSSFTRSWKVALVKIPNSAESHACSPGKVTPRCGT